jgi:phosphatidylglycerol:prolipoprotein diacylglycerol transferase
MRQILLRIPIPGADHTIPLYGYGAMLCLGFLAAIHVAKYHARRLDRGADTVYNAALCAFLGGVLGARLFFIVQHQGWALSVWDLVKIWEGGLTYYGGLLLGTAAVIGYLALTRKPVLYWSDIFAPSLAVGLAFGRIGCLLNGCCFGDKSNLPWAITWPVGSIPWHHYAAEHLAAHGTSLVSLSGGHLGAVMGSTAAVWTMPAVHPAQVYAAINVLLVFVLLGLLLSRKREAGASRNREARTSPWRGDGHVILVFFLLYGASRFLLEFVRADEPETYLLGLTISQNVAILTVLASGAGLVLLRRRGRLALERHRAWPSRPGRADPKSEIPGRRGDRNPKHGTSRGA